MEFTLEHIGLAARDTVALKNWYESILGARVLYQVDQSPPAFFMEIPGGVLIEIYAADRTISETGVNSTAGWRHLALQVTSLERARAELEGRGIAFPDPVKPAGGGGKIHFFKDPEGNLLHLVERPSGSIFQRMPESSKLGRASR